MIIDYKYLIGIDEVGRGPVAGPVAVGAVLISKENLEKVEKTFESLEIKLQESDLYPQTSDVCVCKKRFRDSKKMSPKKRNECFKKIRQAKENGLLDYKVIFMDNKKIDKFGIAPSIKACVDKSLKSLQTRWVSNTQQSECLVLLDGGLKAPEKFDQKSIIKGDEKEMAIALASIVAKVTRDALMCKFAKEYPEYGFEKHKGYGTKYHMEAIKKYGVCDIHRRTFLHLK